MIQIDKISFAYGKQDQIFASLSHRILCGETWAILGFNGAGKSTLIKMLLGIITPQDGSITINGYEVTKHRKKLMKNIGIVWGQKPTLWWDVPVKLSYNALQRIYRIPRDTFFSRLSYYDSLLNLSEFWNRPLRTLSLGQRVKSEIVASLLHEPDLLIYDEPFIGLDFFTREKILETILAYKAKTHCTLILTSHNVADIEKLCQNILLLNKGKTIYSGSLEQLHSAYVGLHRITVLHKNQHLWLAEDVEQRLYKCIREDNKTHIEFTESNISFRTLVSCIVELNEVINIASNENILENIISSLITKEVQ